MVRIISFHIPLEIVTDTIVSNNAIDSSENVIRELQETKRNSKLHYQYSFSLYYCSIEDIWISSNRLGSEITHTFEYSSIHPQQKL